MPKTEQLKLETIGLKLEKKEVKTEQHSEAELSLLFVSFIHVIINKW